MPQGVLGQAALGYYLDLAATRREPELRHAREPQVASVGGAIQLGLCVLGRHGRLNRIRIRSLCHRDANVGGRSGWKLGKPERTGDSDAVSPIRTERTRSGHLDHSGLT